MTELYPEKTTFEQQRAARERAIEFRDLVMRHLESVEGEPTFEQMAAAVRFAGESQKPDAGELTYEHYGEEYGDA